MNWSFFQAPAITTQTATLVPLRRRGDSPLSQLTPARIIDSNAPPGLGAFSEGGTPFKRALRLPPPPPPATRSTRTGIGVGGFMDSAFGWLFVDAETKASIEASDKKLAELNQDALDRGVITRDMYDQTAKHIEESDYEAILTDPDTSIFRGFVQGAEEGLLADVELAKDVTQKVTSGVFGSIPVQIYAVVGVALLALYLFKKK